MTVDFMARPRIPPFIVIFTFCDFTAMLPSEEMWSITAPPAMVSPATVPTKILFVALKSTLTLSNLILLTLALLLRVEKKPRLEENRDRHETNQNKIKVENEIRGLTGPPIIRIENEALEDSRVHHL